MLIELRGGQIVDQEPAAICDRSTSSSVPSRSIYLHDGVIRHVAPADQRVDAVYDASDQVIMAGGIDLHTHIGGGKVNIARMLLPERERTSKDNTSREKPWLQPLSCPVPAAWEIGKRYLQMGYTTCFEPAILPANARQSHAEMFDIPWLDTGGYLLLGNDRLLLEWIAQDVSQTQITDYVGWMLAAHQCCAVKVVNPGGIDAFKFNQRAMDLDTPHVHFGVTPRKILLALAVAVEELRLTHPLHVHCSNLGMPGNIATTLGTIEAVEGRRIHLTHAQYHCYGTDERHEFSSDAKALADIVNENSSVSIDVGQVLFGQTVTLSADVMHQFEHRKLATPKKSIFQDLECQAGCGVVPFRYRQSQFVHGLQWTIGLELFLRIQDSSRAFLTTDHPNGGPFTGYPHLIRLLMDYDFRMTIFDQLHPEVKRMSTLPELKRELSLQEIAAMTRSGPARSLGLAGRGTLADGAVADVVCYPKSANAESMFGNPTRVFRKGTLVYRGGEFIADCRKSVVTPTLEIESTIQKRMEIEYPKRYGYSPAMTRIQRDELSQNGAVDFIAVDRRAT